MRNNLIVSLIESQFNQHGEAIDAYVKTSDGEFTLSDSVACEDGRNIGLCDNLCNRHVLKIKSRTPLTIIDFNSWIKDAPIKKCDYIIFDEEEDKKRFAFCELTCTISEYVDDREGTGQAGKRAKACAQMQTIWGIIEKDSNPQLPVAIFQYREKAGIFGWRERKIKNETESVRSMLRFTRIPGSESNINVYDQYSFGGGTFKFIEVKYPAVFDW